MSTETGLPDAVVLALRRGDKIGAIKLLREQTGIGLKEAKDAVEAAEIAPDDKAAPGEVRPGSAVGWVIAATVLAAAAWYFFR